MAVECGLLLSPAMSSPVRLDTSARDIARAIDDVLDGVHEIDDEVDDGVENAWLDALSDNDFEANVVIDVVNDNFVIEVNSTDSIDNARHDVDESAIVESVDRVDTAVIGLTGRARAVTTPRANTTAAEPICSGFDGCEVTIERTMERASNYDAWYAKYLAGELPEPLPRSRAPRASASMPRPSGSRDRTG